jgi:hypothetical protein
MVKNFFITPINTKTKEMLTKYKSLVIMNVNISVKIQ